MADSYFHETFDGGVGALGHAWGSIDTSVPGQITLSHGAAAMEWAFGAADGHGYGTYEVTAQVHNNGQPGAAIVFWPSDDAWPGSEIDMAETAVDGSGRLYGNVHWNDHGRDAYNYVIFDGVDPNAVHAFVVEWVPDRITFLVDGREMGSFFDHVPVAFEDGGSNVTFGALNTNDATSLTLYDMRFTPLHGSAPAPGPETPSPIWGGDTDWAHIGAVVQGFYDTHGWWASYDQILAMSEGSGPAAPPPPPPADPGTDDVDWNALAAQVQANFEATGRWFI